MLQVPIRHTEGATSYNLWSLMNLQPSDLVFIAFVLWLAWEAINGDDGGGGGRRRGRVPASA